MPEQNFGLVLLTIKQHHRQNLWWVRERATGTYLQGTESDKRY